MPKGNPNREVARQSRGLRRAEWRERSGFGLIAILTYLTYLVVAAALAFGVFAYIKWGPESKTSETTKIVNGETIKTTTQRSEPFTLIVAVLGAVGVSGAMVIPLKFFWDELANRAKGRRDVETALRERLETYAEKYYMPLAYALEDLKTESDNLKGQLEARRNSGAEVKEVVVDRWLYSVAQVWQIRRNMRSNGGSLFFRSHRGEDHFFYTYAILRREIDRICEDRGIERSILASGVADIGATGFLAFRTRVLPVHPKRFHRDADPWHNLRAVRAAVLLKCRNALGPEPFERVEKAAGNAWRFLLFYTTDIDAPWYSDAVTTEDRIEIAAAIVWLDDQRKRETA
jgi:hypothetical protein